MARQIFLLLSTLVGCAFALNGELMELECPVDCDCHYFRVNWVTDCSESNLTSIPYSELSRDVYILDLNGNNIEDLDPFPGDIKLRRLQMAHNKLTHLDYDSFAGLDYLLDADFSSNAITKVDPDTFRDSPGLITLELQNNPLEEVQGQFLNCRTLLYLDISSCAIRKLNNEFFYNTTNLNKLDLSHNPLGQIEPGPFDLLTSLEYLQMNDCNISHISPEAFDQLQNLRELEMTQNDLRSLRWTKVLSPLVRLEHLDIRNTKITNLPKDAFAKNHHLRSLILADNELWYLDVGDTLGHNLDNLQSLDLSNCNLKDPLSEEAFKDAGKLRILNFSGNPMFFAADLTAVLRHLPTLHRLSISNCSLSRLPNAFHILENLEELDISHNPLSDAFVSLLNPLRSLVDLDMSYCKLGYVGNNTFAQMTSLKRLILSGNQLHTLEQGLFANLSSLESLELNNCGLQKPIDPKVFGDQVQTNIIELQLSKNPLVVSEEALLPKQLSMLEILDISHCNLTDLHENVFSYTKNITKLNLSNNKLSDTNSLAMLKKLRLLEHLDLSGNKFTYISPKMFKANSRLLSVNLLSNPFVCNCSVVDMWDWAVQEKKDSQVLVGGQPVHFATGAAKLKKALSCSYDPETYRDMRERTDRKHQRKGDLSPNRTWAKYIRESNCGKKL